MNAKTQFQKKVVAISKRLPSLTDRQLYKFINNIDYPVFIDNHGYTCSCCNHRFTEEHKFCPVCGRRLHYDDYYRNKRTIRSVYSYQALVLQRQGMTITRHYLFRCTFYKGSGYNMRFGEVERTFYSENGEYEVMAVKRNCLGQYLYESQWIFGSEMKLMSNKCNEAYSVPLAYSIYHSHKNIPQYSSLLDAVHDTAHYTQPISKAVRACPQLETIHKQHPELFRYFMTDTHSLIKYWSSLKIAFRNKFRIGSIYDYLSYLQHLEKLGKDLHNPKFVAPQNYLLAAEYARQNYHMWLLDHNPAFARAERQRNVQLLNQMEAQSRFDEEVKAYDYAKAHKEWLDILIRSRHLVIRPLQSIEDFKDEANAMHHCVYSNKYWKKPNTLILSARIGDRRIETVELNTKTFDIVQSRGVCNKITEYHTEIINAIRKHFKKTA